MEQTQSKSILKRVAIYGLLSASVFGVISLVVAVMLCMPKTYQEENASHAIRIFFYGFLGSLVGGLAGILVGIFFDRFPDVVKQRIRSIQSLFRVSLYLGIIISIFYGHAELFKSSVKAYSLGQVWQGTGCMYGLMLPIMALLFIVLAYSFIVSIYFPLDLITLIFLKFNYKLFRIVIFTIGFGLTFGIIFSPFFFFKTNDPRIDNLPLDCYPILSHYKKIVYELCMGAFVGWLSAAIWPNQKLSGKANAVSSAWGFFLGLIISIPFAFTFPVMHPVLLEFSLATLVTLSISLLAALLQEQYSDSKIWKYFENFALRSLVIFVCIFSAISIGRLLIPSQTPSANISLKLNWLDQKISQNKTLGLYDIEILNTGKVPVTHARVVIMIDPQFWRRSFSTSWIKRVEIDNLQPNKPMLVKIEDGPKTTQAVVPRLVTIMAEQ